MKQVNFSLILPVFNEENIVEVTINEIIKLRKTNKTFFEIIVVNDGSNDSTSFKLKKFGSIEGIKIINHEKNYGYGRALKSGIINSNSDIVFISDVDGTYPNNKILEFYAQFIEKKVDMLVGARDMFGPNISLIRKPPKFIINKLANFLVDQNIPDLNSGFRIFKKELALKYMNLLPNGFSFTTTITLASFSEFKLVNYVDIDYQKRVGKSKIHPIKDTLNFVILILKVIVYFNPLKVFIPLSIFFFIMGFCFFAYRMLLGGQFLVTSVISILFATNFLFLGLIADLINKKR